MKTAAIAANIALFALVSPLAAQQPAFEVASVRPSDANATRSEINGFYTYPGGRVVGHGCTLEYLVMLAFNLPRWAVSNGPSWMTSDRFDIEARPPASSASAKSNPYTSKLPPNDEQRQMLLTLLLDRFQLKVHRESKTGTVYILAAGPKPPKLQDSKNKEDFPWAGSPRGGMVSGDGLAGINISMAQLAKRMEEPLGRPVLDKTGLTGAFDFHFQYQTDDPHPDIVATLITSLQALGLKLEPSKGPVETVTIDHAEKPSQN